MPALSHIRGVLRGGSLPKAVARIVFLVFAALATLQAASAQQVSLEGSIKEVATASPTRLFDPHKPFVTRMTLKQAETDATMEFEVALKMRNFSELQQRVAKGEIISPEEMAQKYDPTAADEQAVADWLRSQGLALARRDKNHLAIFVRGSVGQIGRALQVNFARVTSEGTEYTSAITAPSVPGTIAPLLVGINGLQPHLRAHKHSIVSGSAPYTPSQIATAYNANGLYASNVTGAGQTIAVVMDTFPLAGDLTSFWQTYGVNQSINNISFIQVVAGTLPTDTAEVTLDTEWASSIAPGAQVRVYATEDLAYTETDQAYQQIYIDATTYGIHQVSLSYAGGELTDTSADQLKADKQFFATLASAGIAVFAASGDGGSTPDNSGGTNGPTQVEYPASDPNVTGVGGTTFESSYYTGGQNLEYGWYLSGGGTSAPTFFSRPSYQNGVAGMPSGTQRCVPDVSCAADPHYPGAVILNGQETAYGGTSWSTPIWAGFCALINQARASASLPAIGPINSSLYSQAGTSSFTDITTGSNGYGAGTGYDLVTGIGVPSTQNLAVALSPGWIFSPESVLHNFGDGSVTNDGNNPSTGVIKGTDGSFYGVSRSSVSYAGGNIYKVTPQGVVTVLHNFGDDTVTNDGSSPEGGLVQASDGNFYGTTYEGGAGGSGTVFKMTPQGKVTILHSFPDGSVTRDGTFPEAALVQGSDGNLYGSTVAGGSARYGIIFKITTQGTYTVLHNFMDGTVYDEGYSPNALIQGSDGNFYGTDAAGGASNSGTVFKMTPAGVMTTLHNFGDSSVPNDGGGPNAALVQGLDGNFYGTTSSGGSAYAGTIFQVTAQGVMTILHSFNDGSVVDDGQAPQGALIQGSDGTFYGTTYQGGASYSGTVLKMTPQGVVSTIYSFQTYQNGVDPTSSLVLASDGSFYGTTSGGGTATYGTFFKLLPKLAPNFTSPNTATFTVGVSGSFTVTTTGSPAPTLSARGLPSWASFNPSTGVISGMPTNTTGQPFTVTLTAINGVGGFATQTLTLNVQTVSQLIAPTITNSPLSATADVGTACSFSYQATGAPTPFFSLASGSLPSGLSLSSAGVLSGMPIQTGTFTGTVSASNGVGTAATQSFAITVQRAPTFTNGSPPSTGSLGTPYSFTFSALGPPAPTFSVPPGTLPPGLTLTSAGVLSGTPTQGGYFSVSVTATNGAGSASESFAITVQQAPAFTSQPVITTIGVNTYYYNSSIQASGYPVSTFSVTGTFPPGIDFLSDGIMNGYPSQTGTYTGTITANNGVGTPATQNFSITVALAPSFSNTPPSPLTVGVPYSFTYQALGYPAPTFSTSGNLPPGISLTSAGVLSGTPTQAGTFSFVVTATNSYSFATQNVILTVYADAAPVFTDGPAPSTGATGVAYSFTYTASGFPAPTFGVASGNLPTGLALSPTGVLSGIPIQAGTFTGTVSASNGINPVATQTFNIIITQSAITYLILHNFGDGSVSYDGAYPQAGLVEGTDGNYYGVTPAAGYHNVGMVFQCTPAGTVANIYSFNPGTADGQGPTGPLVRGADGNFYGTTQNGGSSGDGTVFKITPQGTETILYSFGSGSVTPDGTSPYGALTLGKDGNFYGTTTSGGTSNDGIVFKVTPQGTETILHNFGGTAANDGSGPRGGLIQASDGNCYGMTQTGGSANDGTIFEMTPGGAVTILYNFGDGSIPNGQPIPFSGLIQGRDGNLYGMRECGGTSNYGTFFKIPLAGAGGAMTILHNFSASSDPIYPSDALILGPDGNFYGTSYYGGTAGTGGYGSIFMITPQGAVTLLHSFLDGTVSKDGANPTASLVLGSDGNFYGTTEHGGTGNSGNGEGIVFQLSISSPPTITSAASTTFTAGRSGSFAFTATGNPAPTFSATGLPSWATLSATGVLSGTPLDTTGAPFTVTLTAKNGNSPDATQTFTLNVQPVLKFGQWEASYPNPITSGPTATPENDGVSNLLKYLYDINPGEPMSAADRAALPAMGMTTIEGANYLTLTYREYQQLDPNNLIVYLQTSSDLQTWQTMTNATPVPVGTDSNTGDPIMQFQVPVTGGNQFLRLNVISP